MKLYELKRGTHFRIVEDSTIPPGAPAVDQMTTYKLNNIDGMYSHCQDKDGNVVHVAAFTEVEEVLDPKNS